MHFPSLQGYIFVDHNFSNRKLFQSIFLHIETVLTFNSCVCVEVLYTWTSTINPYLHYLLWAEIPHLQRICFTWSVPGNSWPWIRRTPCIYQIPGITFQKSVNFVLCVVKNSNLMYKCSVSCDLTAHMCKGSLLAALLFWEKGVIVQAVGGASMSSAESSFLLKRWVCCLYLSTSFLFHLMPLLDIHLQLHMLFHMHNYRQLFSSIAERCCSIVWVFRVGQQLCSDNSSEARTVCHL